MVLHVLPNKKEPGRRRHGENVSMLAMMLDDIISTRLLLHDFVMNHIP